MKRFYWIIIQILTILPENRSGNLISNRLSKEIFVKENIVIPELLQLLYLPLHKKIKTELFQELVDITETDIKLTIVHNPEKVNRTYKPYLVGLFFIIVITIFFFIYKNYSLEENVNHNDADGPSDQYQSYKKETTNSKTISNSEKYQDRKPIIQLLTSLFLKKEEGGKYYLIQEANDYYFLEKKAGAQKFLKKKSAFVNYVSKTFSIFNLFFEKINHTLSVKQKSGKYIEINYTTYKFLLETHQDIYFFNNDSIKDFSAKEKNITITNEKIATDIPYLCDFIFSEESFKQMTRFVESEINKIIEKEVQNVNSFIEVLMTRFPKKDKLAEELTGKYYFDDSGSIYLMLTFRDQRQKQRISDIHILEIFFSIEKFREKYKEKVSWKEIRIGTEKYYPIIINKNIYEYVLKKAQGFFLFGFSFFLYNVDTNLEKMFCLDFGQQKDQVSEISPLIKLNYDCESMIHLFFKITIEKIEKDIFNIFPESQTKVLSEKEGEEILSRVIDSYPKREEIFLAKYYLIENQSLSLLMIKFHKIDKSPYMMPNIGAFVYEFLQLINEKTQPENHIVIKKKVNNEAANKNLRENITELTEDTINELEKKIRYCFLLTKSGLLYGASFKQKYEDYFNQKFELNLDLEVKKQVSKGFLKVLQSKQEEHISKKIKVSLKNKEKEIGILQIGDIMSELLLKNMKTTIEKYFDEIAGGIQKSNIKI